MPRTLLELLRGCRDERHARALRDAFGRRRWLLSWHPDLGGCWCARLSCPEWPETVERHGPTRREAIDRAAEALARLVDDARADWPAAARPR